MPEPRVIPRAEHTLSRSDVDPDALKVLYRLQQAGYAAYLVGGGVRDLLLSRKPKDFDIGTSAHPYQVKKLFRNCWIIGRRFRLAHVKFGTKVIEVATFRRQVQPGEEVVQDGVPAHPSHGHPGDETPASLAGAATHTDDGSQQASRDDAQLIHRDNTFGTPEEDALRRDFTINALFYDIATFSIIDYVGGLDDLRDGIIRCIGDPFVRFREDPVRMMRAIAIASRLDFIIEDPIYDAIGGLRHEIANSSMARLLEEYYKILRAGSSEKTFQALSASGLLEPISRELHDGAGAALWQSLRNVDAYRNKFGGTPDTLTNAVLLGSLLAPLGLAPQPGRGPSRREDERPREPLARLGTLPLARRDLERLRQVLGMQRRLREITATIRAQRALTHRSIFREALTWLEVHGNAPEVVEHWITVLAERGADEPVGHGAEPGNEAAAEHGDRPRRRRRRRRRKPFKAAE